MKNLLLVESPSKAKTISKYLGRDWKVLATYGHVRGLPSKKNSVEPEKDFLMHYEYNDRSKKHLDAITHYIIENNSEVNVYLGTDPDREGEAIAWHVVEAIKLEKKIKFSKLNIKRSVFNAITKELIKEAIANSREIDQNLVDAQQSRQALDYLVGFTISPILWRTVGGNGASAGRVQSVALRLMAEREFEILNFDSQEYWSIHGKFDGKNNISLDANLIIFNNKKLEKFSFKKEKETLEAMEELKTPYFIKGIEQKKQNKNPYPPFTTSSLQQEASKRLGFTPKRTMMIAQKLYEGVTVNGENSGLITYMRTDGVYVTDEAINETRSFIKDKFGAKYLPKEKRAYVNKIKNAQEAHEAIRPTHLSSSFSPEVLESALTSEELSLYNLIWKRMVASQMSSATYDITNIFIINENKDSEFKSSFSNISFDGFLAAYEYNQEAADDEEHQVKKLDLTKLKVGDAIVLKKIENKQHFTEPPARYSEAGLIKKMEEIGIGRPSTYASIISTLQDREYVELKQKRFNVTIRGHVISNFLVTFFPQYFAYDFTANMENDLDKVADGQMKWKKLMHSFWDGFDENAKNVLKTEILKILDSVNEHMRQYLFPIDPKINEINDNCPSCKEAGRENGKLRLKFSKFGYFLGCANYPECSYKKTLSAGLQEVNMVSEEDDYIYKDEKVIVRLKKGRFGNYLEVASLIEEVKHNIGLSDKMTKDLTPEIIKKFIMLPLFIGNHPQDGQPIKLNLGQYGFYVAHGRDFASVKLPDPYAITLDEALILLEQNLEKIKRNTQEIDLGELGKFNIQKGGFQRLYLKIEDAKVLLPKELKFANIDKEALKEFIIKLQKKKKKIVKDKTK